MYISNRSVFVNSLNNPEIGLRLTKSFKKSVLKLVPLQTFDLLPNTRPKTDLQLLSFPFNYKSHFLPKVLLGLEHEGVPDHGVPIS